MNPTQTQPNTQTDMDALNLTHAIALSESGSNGKPNYNAKGASGEHGAYQWMPGNFEAGAKSAGLDPNDFSPENQDKVAYAQIKEYKDKGYDPGQISSLWNSGSPNNWQNHSGTNKLGVSYDTPAYVKKVQQNYQQLKGTQGYNPTPYSKPTNGNAVPDNSVANLPDNPPPTDTSLGNELINRTNDAGQAIADTVSGKQNIVSGLLQTVGAGAGAIGDVVNKGLELIPGVKQVENLLGQGIGALAKTAPGQAVVKSINDFSTAHPELSKDIGAGFNIVTAIPILKGLGAIGKIGMEAGSQALKDVVVKGFSEDLASSGGKLAQKVFTPDVVDTSIKYGVAPEIKSIGGKTITDTTLAQQTLEKAVSKIETEQYQPALKGITLKFPIEGVKNVANDIAIENLSDPNAVNKIIDRVAAKYGETPTLEQLNQAKRDITKKISQNGFADPDLSNNRIARMALQKTIEQNSLQFGGGNIQAINKDMGNILKTINFYEKIDGMGVKQGLLHKGIKAISTGAGAGIGGMFGNPIAGGAIGYGASDYAEGLLTKATPRAVRAGVIRNTGANAVKLSKEELAKKLGGLFGGVAGQQVNRSKQ